MVNHPRRAASPLPPIADDTCNREVVFSASGEGGAIINSRPMSGASSFRPAPEINEHMLDGVSASSFVPAGAEIRYIDQAPSVLDVIRQAWHGGAYDIRIIFDAPRKIRTSGAIVRFVGIPKINLSWAGRKPLDPKITMGWEHISQAPAAVQALIDRAELEGHYCISFRPNIGGEIMRHRRKKCGPLDERGRRLEPLPAMPGYEHRHDLIRANAPAEFNIRFFPLRISRADRITWWESSTPLS